MLFVPSARQHDLLQVIRKGSQSPKKPPSSEDGQSLNESMG